MHTMEMCDYFMSKLYFVAQNNSIFIHFLEIRARLIFKLKDYRLVIINACILCTRSYGSECVIENESVHKTCGILLYNSLVCDEPSHIMNRNFTI